MHQFQAKWQNKNVTFATNSGLQETWILAFVTDVNVINTSLSSIQLETTWTLAMSPLLTRHDTDRRAVDSKSMFNNYYHKHGGQLGYTGHVLNLPQDIQHFIDKLPVNVSDLPILTVVRQGAANTHHSFRVRPEMHYNGSNSITDFTKTLK